LSPGVRRKRRSFPARGSSCDTATSSVFLAFWSRRRPLCRPRADRPLRSCRVDHRSFTHRVGRNGSQLASKPFWRLANRDDVCGQSAGARGYRSILSFTKFSSMRGLRSFFSCAFKLLDTNSNTEPFFFWTKQAPGVNNDRLLYYGSIIQHFFVTTIPPICFSFLNPPDSSSRLGLFGSFRNAAADRFSAQPPASPVAGTLLDCRSSMSVVDASFSDPSPVQGAIFRFSV